MYVCCDDDDDDDDDEHDDDDDDDDDILVRVSLCLPVCLPLYSCLESRIVANSFEVIGEQTCCSTHRTVLSCILPFLVSRCAAKVPTRHRADVLAGGQLGN
jgi:hypothetical protein